jgi:transposase
MSLRSSGLRLLNPSSLSVFLAIPKYTNDDILHFAGISLPPKSNRSDPICFSVYLYRARNRVERFFNRIKQCRRVAMRYDRLAGNYFAFVQLASIRLWLAAVMSPRPS